LLTDWDAGGQDKITRPSTMAQVPFRILYIVVGGRVGIVTVKSTDLIGSSSFRRSCSASRPNSRAAFSSFNVLAPTRRVSVSTENEGISLSIYSVALAADGLSYVFELFVITTRYSEGVFEQEWAV